MSASSLPAARMLRNRTARPGEPYPHDLLGVLDRSSAEAAWRVVRQWPAYAPTPLRSLPGLASLLGLAEVRYKDESLRFGLGSFKALGGAYGVYRVLEREIIRATGRAEVDPREVLSGVFSEICARITVCCATAGNHGRSVAWGARLFGCRAVIFLPADVSPERAGRIEREGATITRVSGGYDEAVHVAAAVAERFGWHVVSDTAYGEYMEVPQDIMHAYTLLAEEVVQEWRGDPPTHVFLQCGVGGLAAAVCAHFWWSWGERRPCVVVVEPETGACMYASAEQEREARVSTAPNPGMSCLNCGQPSSLAWQVLRWGADAFLLVSEAEATETVNLLARGVAADPPIASTPSGAAGVAGLQVSARHSGLREMLRLDPSSHVLVIGSEGAVAI